jgi:hypothetical protein
MRHAARLTLSHATVRSMNGWPPVGRHVLMLFPNTKCSPTASPAGQPTAVCRGVAAFASRLSSLWSCFVDFWATQQVLQNSWPQLLCTDGGTGSLCMMLRSSHQHCAPMSQSTQAATIDAMCCSCLVIALGLPRRMNADAGATVHTAPLFHT